MRAALLLQPPSPSGPKASRPYSQRTWWRADIVVCICPPPKRLARPDKGMYCSPCTPPSGGRLMPNPLPEHSWFGPAALEPAYQNRPEGTQEFSRLWQAFMTARLTLGLVLVVLQAGSVCCRVRSKPVANGHLRGLFSGYLWRHGLFVRPRHLGQAFNRAWGVLIGLGHCGVLRSAVAARQ